MSSIAQILAQLDLRPKKSFGQNFLVHPESAKKILRWTGIEATDLIVEIGPGLGALTQELLPFCQKLICIEKDKKLETYLTQQFGPSGKLELHIEDAIKTDFASITNGQSYTLFSNLPYNVSTPILENLLQQVEKIQSMTFLLQEELVDRICANPGSKNYGRLSIWVQSLCSTKVGPRVPKTAFHPRPDVESRLFQLRPLDKPLIPAADRVDFLAWVKIVFGQRRKTVASVLKKHFEKETVLKCFQDLQLSESERAENINIPTLFKIYTRLTKQ